MKYGGIISIVICLVSMQNALAQTDNLLKCLKVNPSEQYIVLDSLVLDPSTITLRPNQPFEYDKLKRQIKLIKPITDTILVCYRILPWQPGQQFYKRDKEAYFEDISAYQQRTSSEDVSNILVPPETIINTGSIDKMGAISRSVSFGNSQNVFVNSTLNLQLEGKITDDLNLQAVITDRNIPFQPEGNTQQIRDFDNVFIRLHNDRFDFTAGDVVLKHQEGHFMRYYKNVQGGLVKFQNETTRSKSVTSAAISVAKGQFASVSIDPIEGVQGPYRIRGPNNERFVIVMANSERVFLDGQLLQRGFDRDYIIDYNMAEITFNPGVLVTKFSRIRVDFEYADQNYSRSIMSVGHEQQFSKFKLGTNFYRERDNKNQPLAFALDDLDKQQLSLLPSSERIGNIAGEDSVGFEANRILYAKVDTIADGLRYEIFQYSTDPINAVFAVTFSEVGEFGGNYRPITGTLNGRVFEWVAPIAGVKQGSHEPVVTVPTPNQKQLWVNTLEFQIDEHKQVFTELAVSNMVNNLYASDQANTNTGIGTKTGYRVKAQPLGQTGYKLDGELSFEHNSANFNAIDRFRHIEFDRDWSYVRDSTPQLNERIFVTQFGVDKNVKNNLNYRLSTRQKGALFSGVQQQISLNKALGRINHRSEVFLLNSGQQNIGSDWKRWVADTHLEAGKLIPGYRYQVDRNKVFTTDNDSIFSTAMNFSEHLLYIKTNDTLDNKLRMEVSVREDQLPVEGVFVPQNKAFTWTLVGATPVSGNQRLRYNFTFRRLKNLLDVSQPDELTTMGRMDWSGSFLNKILKSELTYAISNSRELRREFVFIQVNNGLGTHTWRDDNADGVQDITEFYIAINADERNYIKIFTPTDEYLLAFNNLLNYRLGLDFPKSWQNAGSFKSLLSRLSNVTSIALDNKTTSDDFATRYNPFVSTINDSEIISTKENVRSSFFVNRGNPKFGLEAVYFAQSGKQLLTNGVESKGQSGWSFNLRHNVKREITLQMKYDLGEKFNKSDFLENRNYTIKYFHVAPQLVWQPTSQLRAMGQYGYKQKNNDFTDVDNESSKLNEYLFEFRWSKAIERSLMINVRLLEIDFIGNENSPAGYELLEALRPGTNFTWNVQWQQKLVNGLQMALGYEGRTSQNQQVVHIGRMQVTALF